MSSNDQSLKTPYVLVLYYSRTKSCENLALHIARGVDQVRAELLQTNAEVAVEARLRTVPEVSAATERTAPLVPDEGAIYCSKDDLRNCAALALGSATRFGNMAAPMKYFLDTTADLWMHNALADKPASVFTSSNSFHGGQESTLLSMMIPLMHHGMLIQGLPYTEKALNETTSGGTPYGVTHVAKSGSELTSHEADLAVSVGRRLANLAVKLI